MKLSVLAALCLFLLLILPNESMATRGKFGLLNVFKKPSKTKLNHNSRSKESIIKKSKERSQSNYDQQPGGYPQQPGRAGSYPNQGHYPQQPGGYPNQGHYPQQPGGYPNQGHYPQQPGGYPNQGHYPQQPGGYPNQGHYPQQPGGYPNQGHYPQQPGGYPQQPGRAGSYPNQGHYPQRPGGYPQQPYQGGYPQPGYPAGGYPAGGFPHVGGHGYPWGNINHNPNNRILSPHYGGSLGYGGYGVGGGSPFSNSVKMMGFAPSDKSRGFGRSAVIGAAGGAVAGMALGYGLGRFPRPHFHFHSPQEEYYYNYYMYQRHGSRSSSTDTNNYRRYYQHNPPPISFHQYMASCMKRTDLLPVKNPRRQKPTTLSTKPTNHINTTVPSVTAGGNYTTSTTLATLHPEVHPTATDSVKMNTTSVSVTTTSNKSTAKPNVTSSQPQFELSPVLQPERQLSNAAAAAASDGNDDDDDDTVSIMEIGYPALIEQMKVKRCTELYIVYTEKHLEDQKKKMPPVSAGAQRPAMDLVQGLLIVVSGPLVVLLSNNMPLMLHAGFH